MAEQNDVNAADAIRPDSNNPWLHVRFQDQDGNAIGANGFKPSPVWLNNVEASQVEAFGIQLDNNGDTLIVTIQLEDR